LSLIAISKTSIHPTMKLFPVAWHYLSSSAQLNIGLNLLAREGTGLHGLATADCATNKLKVTDEIPLKCMMFNERLVTSDNCRDRRREVQSSSLKADKEGKENQKTKLEASW